MQSRTGRKAAAAAAAEDGGDERIILDGLRRLVRELRTSSQAAERTADLSGAQLFVLRALVREPGLGINALAERTRTHQSSVSVVAAKLVRRGLVRRERSREDARRLVLVPTAAGAALAARGPDPVQERLLAGLVRLGPAARRRLANDLSAWMEAIGLVDQAPGMFFEPSRHG